MTIVQEVDNSSPVVPLENNESSTPVVPNVYFRWKLPLIRLLAAFFLVLASPVIIVLVVLIRLTSPGPAIYRQVRAGKNGKPFLMYKLRTMTVDAESITGPAWGSNQDTRLTPVGRWIRRRHLDELPQLLNVVLGQMDLFGPRPERPEFVRFLRPIIPRYERRMDVLPGITGLAQIALPADTELTCVQRKLRMDLEYIRRANVLLDSRTFACTLLRLTGMQEELAMRISRVSKTIGPVMAELNEMPPPRDIPPATLHQLKAFSVVVDAPCDEQVPVSGGNGDWSPQTLHIHDADALPSAEPGARPPHTGMSSAKRVSSDMSAENKILNALTIDVEDYFQVSGFEQSIDRADWGVYESRVVQNTLRLLRILDRHDVKATFFVLGWVADRFPEIVREIHDRGHEIGSHSYWHRLVYDLTPAEFRDDLRRSRDVLESIVDQRITLFRAPSFSITEDSTWALDILIEEGFTMDSSIYPVHHDRYGMPHAPTHIHTIKREQGEIWELPPSVLKTCGTNLPVAGGGYFRFYPLELTCYAIRRVNQVDKPFLFYLHPWELDPQQPRISAGSRLSQFRHYVNLDKVENRLELLLELFEFGRLSDVFAASNPWGASDDGSSQPGRPR